MVILFGAFLAGTFYVAFQNQSALENTIVFYGDQDMAVWAVIISAFFAGFTLAFALAAFRSSKDAIVRIRGAHGARQRERVEGLYAEGLQAMLGEKPELAERRFKDVLAREPGHRETLLSYGEVLRATKRPRDAADLHRRASEQRPGDVRAHLRR